MNEPVELRFRLLGYPRVELQGRELRLGRKKSLALLCYLAGTGRPLARERAAGLLWPEFAPEKARASVRLAVLDAESAAGGGLFAAPGDPLRFSDGLIVKSELDELRSLAEPTRSPAEGLAALGIEALSSMQGRIESLYGGEFLEGFALKDAYGFEEWQLSEAARYRGLAVLLLGGVGDACFGAGAYAQARSAAEALMRIAPLDESGPRLMAELLAGAGELGSAAAQYEAYAAALKESLGAAPSPAFKKIYRSLQGGAGRDGSASRSAAAAPPGAPIWRDGFFGRERELAELKSLVLERPLVSLTGPGGVGKTRLACELARAAAGDFVDGWAFVDLSSTPHGLVLAAFAAAFGVGLRRGEGPTELARRLAPRSALVVADNCELVAPESAAVISALLSGLPACRVVATSVQPLGLDFERRFALDALDHTGPDSAAARLFLERAGLGAPRDDDERQALASLCQALQGMPLAVELAAARGRSMGLRELAASLADSAVGTLSLEAPDEGGLPPRQRALRSVIAWSWSLLDESEAAFLSAMSLFEAPFGAAEAEALGAARAAALLPQLCDKSFLRRADPNRWPPRWGMLAPIRAFARERLAASGREAELLLRHFEVVEGVAARLGPRLDALRDAAALGDADASWADLRAACIYAAGGVALAYRALTLLMRLRRFFLIRDRSGELRELLTRLEGAAALRESASDPPTCEALRARAAAAELEAVCRWFDLDLEGLYESTHEASEHWRAAGDEVAERRSELIGLAFRDVDAEGYEAARMRLSESAAFFAASALDALAAEAHHRLCARILSWPEGEFSEAAAALAHASELADRCGDLEAQASCRWFEARSARYRGDFEAAERSLLELKLLASALGAGIVGVDADSLAAELRLAAGRYAEAAEAAGRARSGYAKLGHPALSAEQAVVEASALGAGGRREEAIALLRSELSSARELGRPSLLLAYRLALELAASGDEAAATAAMGDESARYAIGSDEQVKLDFFSARLALARGDEAEAERLLKERAAALKDSAGPEYSAAADRYLAFIRAARNPEAALAYARGEADERAGSSTEFHAAWWAAVAARALGSLGSAEAAAELSTLARRFSASRPEAFYYPERAVFSRLPPGAAPTEASPGAPVGEAYVAALAEAIRRAAASAGEARPSP